MQTPLKLPISPPRAMRKWLLISLTILLAFVPAQTLVAQTRTQTQTVDTDPLNRAPQVRKAFQRFYNMDYDGALADFQRVQAAHPNNPIATDYVLYAVLFRELWRLDLLDTTFYANDGFLTGKHTVVENPKVRDQIESLTQKAINQANTRLDKDPHDVNALFARGWAKSLEATYKAMVERSFVSALKLADGAQDDCQDVLDKDPNYVDAKLVVGVYQYVVGALPFGFKLLVGFVGIHGSKSKGMAMLRDSADRGVISSVESRTVMALFLRREGKYQKALNINHELVAQYPRNFLFQLEHANLSKDAGQGMKAVGLYRKVIQEAQQPGYFDSAHVELAFYGLGASLRGQKLYEQSAEAFREGAFQPTTSPELKRRCLLAAGEVYDLMHERKKARQQYRAVLAAGSDTTQGEQARKYLDDPYTGH